MRLSLLVSILLVAACAAQVPDDPMLETYDRSRLPESDLTLNISGLRPCTSSLDQAVHINRYEPVVVLTHGCFGSAARFRALAEVFAFHGQQAICFTYDDRDSLTGSATEMADALRELERHMHQRHITVIAHSQGGLIARKALTQNLANPLWPERKSTIRLVTISAPFAGIAAASHCGSETMLTYTLGLVGLACRVITGSKWFEITDASAFIQQPGELLPEVNEHLKIVTDEHDSCRSYSSGGECLESDFVFSLEEQYHDPVDHHEGVANIEIRAGHSQIVGDYQTPPHELITILQQHGVMRSTPGERQAALDMLLSRLY